MLVVKVLEEAEGGEVFVPKLPSMKIVDLARAIDPDSAFKIIGLRPGEKIHETLISEEEAKYVKAVGNNYVILSPFIDRRNLQEKYGKYPSVSDDFIYRSDLNDHWLTTKDLQDMVRTLQGSEAAPELLEVKQ